MKMENRCLRIAIMVFTIGRLVLGISAQFPLPCRGDTGALIVNCRDCVERGTPQTSPSQECCASMKAYDIFCFCKTLPPIVERFMSMEKAMYAANTCGVPFPPPGDKCGTFVIPGSPPRSLLPTLKT